MARSWSAQLWGDAAVPPGSVTSYEGLLHMRSVGARGYGGTVEADGEAGVGEGDGEGEKAR